MAAAEPRRSIPSAAAASAPASAASARPRARPRTCRRGSECCSERSGAAAAAAASAPRRRFEWPSATRVSYILNGNYRGPVNGNAQVEWIRVGDRYQVNLDLVIGPERAMITRHMTSEGRIAPSGLMPARYDEDTQIALSRPAPRELCSSTMRWCSPTASGASAWPACRTRRASSSS